MIKAYKLDKHFNRGKKNEIHVINQISLDLPSHGLVVLFGPSGSGKTTLLNVLGGLDRASGRIEFNDTHLEGYSMSSWDKIRNKHIGYIFQNYMLLENISIYENIKLTLNMIGITDKDEINKRIEYLLEKVGLKNYKKRKAGLLSGGQQQRVAIARALAKNPDVIIADEPTGNLDSKNTVEIMNIIKTISKEKLVLLVTHERELATFYADRIIELSDGKVVSDTLNQQNGSSLELKHDSDIYLKDLESKSLTSDGIEVSLYSDKPVDQIGIRLVLKNGTLYLDLNQKVAQKVNLLNDKSEVKLINDHYKDMEQSDMKELDSYQFESIIDESLIKKAQPVITWKHAFRLALNKLVNATTKRKFLFAGFILAGFLLLIAFGFMNRMLILEDKLFIQMDKSLVTVYDINKTDLQTLLDTDEVNYVSSRQGADVQFEFPIFYQESNYSNPFLSIEYASAVKDSNILYGRNIQNEGEILMDYRSFEGEYNDLVSVIKAFGYKSPLDLLNTNITLNERTYKLVGFTGKGYAALYLSEIDYYRQFMGHVPGKTLETYRTEWLNTVSYPTTVFVSSSNPEKTIQFIKDNFTNVQAEYDYLKQRSNYLQQMAFFYSFLWVFSTIVMSITLIALFFVLRASLTERIAEISVFRALGVRRIDIVKTFVVEIFMITTTSFIVGYFFGLYYFTNINTNLYDNNLILFPVYMVALGGLFIYGISQLIGLIPVLSLLRKTPAQIMSSYDA